jgi:hypothetical protein
LITDDSAVDINSVNPAKLRKPKHEGSFHTDVTGHLLPNRHSVFRELPLHEISSGDPLLQAGNGGIRAFHSTNSSEKSVSGKRRIGGQLLEKIGLYLPTESSQRACYARLRWPILGETIRLIPLFILLSAAIFSARFQGVPVDYPPY